MVDLPALGLERLFHMCSITSTDRLVSSIMGYTSFHPTKSMLRGTECEHIARKHYIALKKRHGSHVSVQDLLKDACYLGASSDGFISNESGQGVLELKCPAQLNGEDITHLKPLDIGRNAKFYCHTIDSTLHLKEKSNYYCQVQGEMGVIGVKWCDFVVWTEAEEANISVERIYFDELFWNKQLLPKLKNFYVNAIVPEIIARKLQIKL